MSGHSDDGPAAELAALLAAAAEALARGVSDRRHGFHTPVLATLGADGRPRARVVVLRAVEAAPWPEPWRLRVHADGRSDKVVELDADPRAALCFYDAPSALQLRIEGPAVAHRDDAEAGEAFAGSREASLRTYGVEPPSGARIPEAHAYALPPAEAARDAGRAHFAALVMEAAVVEVLHLAASGHRRARFALGPEPDATWLVP